MTDKEIILSIINQIKYNDGFTEVKPCFDKLEIELDEEARIKIKVKLEDTNLAIHHPNNAWMMMVTTDGLKVKPTDLDNKGNLIGKKIDKGYIQAVIIAIIGVSVGFLLNLGQEVVTAVMPSKPQSNMIVLPPIQIVQHTIYVPTKDTPTLSQPTNKK